MGRAPARLVLALIALWMIALTWRLSPQFGNGIRVDGRITTVAAYVDETCGQRVGPAAATCLAEAAEAGQLMLRREQARSMLFILAPLLAYLAIWWPARLLRQRLRRPV